MLQIFSFFDGLETANKYAVKFDLNKFVEIENPLQSEEETDKHTHLIYSGEIVSLNASNLYQTEILERNQIDF